LVLDVDRDGAKEVVVVAAGEHDFRLYVVGLDGQMEAQSQELITMPFAGQLAVADVDRDGFPDVLCASGHRLFAFNRNGVLATGYPQKQESTYVRTELLENWIITYDAPFIYGSSPIIADLDADGIPDPVIGSPNYGLLGADGRTGRPLPYFPLMATASVNSVPSFVDLDQDGDVELVAGSDSGVLYVWDLPASAGGIHWPCAYHDAAHTGLIPDSELPTPPAAETALVTSCYVYPNPAGDRTTLRYRLGTSASQVRVRTLDMAAEPVGDETDGPCVARSDNELVMNLDEFAPGLYVVRVEVLGNGTRAVQFVKLAIVR